MKRVPRYLRRPRAERRDRDWATFMRTVGGAPNLTGVRVDERSALSLTSAYACINVIATDLASLPIKLYRTRKSGGRDEATGDPRSALLKWNPDGAGDSTSLQWRRAWMGHTLGWGRGLAEIGRDGAGMPTGLHLLDPNPDATTPKRRKRDGRLYYQLASGKTIPGYDVLHLAGLGFDGLDGYTPVRLFRQAMALGLVQEAFSGAFYGNASTPRGALKTAQRLSAPAVKVVKEQLESLHQGVENAHRVLILPEGLEFQPFSINPEDAQFLASRQFQVLEICRIYRVPPHKVMDYSQAHLANLEESNLDYLMTTLNPWALAMEQVCCLRLLTAEERAGGYYFEHLLTALLRGNMKARAEFYEIMERIGAMSPNQIAERENMNPIDNGDVHLIMTNMTTLENIGQADPSQEPATNATRDAILANGRAH